LALTLVLTHALLPLRLPSCSLLSALSAGAALSAAGLCGAALSARALSAARGKPTRRCGPDIGVTATTVAAAAATAATPAAATAASRIRIIDLAHGEYCCTHRCGSDETP
jgi:hypothetical protein